jgi:hypothetical protein
MRSMFNYPMQMIETQLCFELGGVSTCIPEHTMQGTAPATASRGNRSVDEWRSPCGKRKT